MSTKTAYDRGGIVRFVTILGLTLLLAACSSAVNRFGPFENQKTAVADPGYPPSRQIHTSSISRPQKADAYNRTVERTNLNDTPHKPIVAAQNYMRPKHVKVRAGDTLYSISRNHNVAVDALIAENNLNKPYHVRTGQVLVVPVANVASTRSTFERRSIRTTSSYVVKPGETLYRISVSHGLKADQVADYNKIPAPYNIAPGQVLKLPASKSAGIYTKSGKTVKTASVLKITKPARDKGKSVKMASLKSPRKVKRNTKRRAAYTGPLAQPAARSSEKFRWPVKGRVISHFGTKRNGQKNDGINITVPSGTSVKAAENGVVAYAGNELRGYGNLVLVRHAGGWVTAYAHNSKMLVRRGDKVRRGQIIAKAGQTGSVTNPQLHFELRKGSKAVNPISYLSPTTMASK